MLHLIGVWKMSHKRTNSPDGRHGVPLQPSTSSVQLSHGFSSVSDPVFLAALYSWPMATMAAAGHIFLTSFPH